jgi:hypothetical protein
MKLVLDKNKLTSKGLNILLVDKSVKYNSNLSDYSLKRI